MVDLLRRISGIRFCFFAAFALCLATSCSVYHPQMVDVPLLTHKGDGHADLGVSMQWLLVPTSIEANVSGSYAATDWLAVQAAGVYDGSKTGYAQAAMGYYHPWEKFTFEAYLGGGLGHANSLGDKERETQKYTEGDYRTLFVQLDAGWVSLLSGHLDLGMGVKGGLFFPDFVHYSATDSHGQRSMAQYDDMHTLIEPMLMLRVGGEHLKLSLKAGLTQLFRKGADAQFDYSPIGVSAGINYRF